MIYRIIGFIITALSYPFVFMSAELYESSSNKGVQIFVTLFGAYGVIAIIGIGIYLMVCGKKTIE